VKETGGERRGERRVGEGTTGPTVCHMPGFAPAKAKYIYIGRSASWYMGLLVSVLISCLSVSLLTA